MKPNTVALPGIAPLAAHQLAMPAQHRFRLKEADEVAQLVR